MSSTKFRPLHYAIADYETKTIHSRYMHSGVYAVYEKMDQVRYKAHNITHPNPKVCPDWVKALCHAEDAKNWPTPEPAETARRMAIYEKAVQDARGSIVSQYLVPLFCEHLTELSKRCPTLRIYHTHVMGSESFFDEDDGARPKSTEFSYEVPEDGPTEPAYVKTLPIWEIIHGLQFNNLHKEWCEWPGFAALSALHDLRETIADSSSNFSQVALSFRIINNQWTRVP